MIQRGRGSTVPPRTGGVPSCRPPQLRGAFFAWTRTNSHAGNCFSRSACMPRICWPQPRTRASCVRKMRLRRLSDVRSCSVPFTASGTAPSGASGKPPSGVYPVALIASKSVTRADARSMRPAAISSTSFFKLETTVRLPIRAEKTDRLRISAAKASRISALPKYVGSRSRISAILAASGLKRFSGIRFRLVGPWKTSSRGP